MSHGMFLKVCLMLEQFSRILFPCSIYKTATICSLYAKKMREGSVFFGVESIWVFDHNMGMWHSFLGGSVNVRGVAFLLFSLLLPISRRCGFHCLLGCLCTLCLEVVEASALPAVDAHPLMRTLHTLSAMRERKNYPTPHLHARQHHRLRHCKTDELHLAPASTPECKFLQYLQKEVRHYVKQNLVWCTNLQSSCAVQRASCWVYLHLCEL